MVDIYRWGRDLRFEWLWQGQKHYSQTIGPEYLEDGEAYSAHGHDVEKRLVVQGGDNHEHTEL